MSVWVMSHLELAPRVEQYNIDEDVSGYSRYRRCIDFEDFGRQLHEHVRSGTGPRPSASEWDRQNALAKARNGHRMVAVRRRVNFALTLHNQKRTEKLLSLRPVEDTRCGPQDLKANLQWDHHSTAALARANQRSSGKL